MNNEPTKSLLERTYKGYCQNVLDWSLYSDAYTGEGGFKNGDYLIKHDKESPLKYSNRKRISYYLNYCAPVINTFIGFLTKIKPVRKDENDVLGSFYEHTDLAKTKSMDEYAREITLEYLTLGTVFIAVDTPTLQAETRQEEIDGNVKPYSYILDPNAVYDYKKDAHGRLIWIKIKEEYIPPEELLKPLGDHKPHIRYRIWTTQEWSLYNEKGELIITEPHEFGEVPILLLEGRSIINDISRLCKRLFNLLSELDELLRGQTFAILLYPAMDAKDLDGLELGTDRVLIFPPDSKHAPHYIAPSADSTGAYETRIRDLIEEIYRIAGLKYKGGAMPSGIALAYEFENMNQVLAYISENIRDTEVRLAKLVMNTQKEGDIGKLEIEYPKEFNLLDLQAEIKNGFDALEINVSDTFNKEFKKKLVRKLLPNLASKTKDTIDAEIEASLQESDAEIDKINNETENT